MSLLHLFLINILHVHLITHFSIQLFYLLPFHLFLYYFVLYLVLPDSGSMCDSYDRDACPDLPIAYIPVFHFF